MSVCECVSVCVLLLESVFWKRQCFTGKIHISGKREAETKAVGDEVKLLRNVRNEVNTLLWNQDFPPPQPTPSPFLFLSASLYLSHYPSSVIIKTKRKKHKYAKHENNKSVCNYMAKNLWTHPCSSECHMLLQPLLRSCCF